MKRIKNKSIFYKGVLGFFILILAGLYFINTVYATHINSANIYSTGDCGALLKYKGTEVRVSYVQYIKDGIEFPAYCLDKTKPGAETTPYTVSIQDTINDVALWRRVVNGYPYKSLQELGVENKEEAFTATKQAIYCYIHGNNPEDYEGIGDAGERTLNAMKKIIENSQNSNETKIANNVIINTDKDEWKQDKIEKQYLSKEFSIESKSNIKKYKVEISNENKIDIGGIKLTNLANEEKTDFSPNEKFKILIPIKNTQEGGSIKIKVQTQMATKPVLYGTAPDSGYQDYALAAEIYEDSTGETTDNYSKNETKIVISKQDMEEKVPLENVEFELLDENKNTVYTGLKTNKDGKIVIENILPGKYYIRESKSIDGYQVKDELIDTEVLLNQKVTVNIYNEKEEKPKVEVKTSEKVKEVKSKQEKKLPITGM